MVALFFIWRAFWGERAGNFCPLMHEGSAVLLSGALGTKEGSPTATRRRAELIGIQEQLSPLKNHAYVVQAGDEGRAVDLL
jgi:hypothetical protein